MTKRQRKTDKRTKALEVNIELVVRGHAAPAEGCVPPGVIRHETVRLASASVMRILDEAQNMGFQLLVENRLDESGDVVLDIAMYGDDIRVEEEIDGLWPRPGKWASVQRDITDDQADLFDDPRWFKYAARGVWGWIHVGACYRGDVLHDEDWELMWVADFSDIPLRAG